MKDSIININEPYYEYAVEAITDKLLGDANVKRLTETLQARAANGWRLVTAVANELGVNAISVGNIGLNSAMGQTVLIFERRIVKKTEEEPYTNYKDEVPVIMSNMVSPLLPTRLALDGNGDEALIALRIVVKGDFLLNGMHCDLKLRNRFGDTVVFEDTYFYSFEKGSKGEVVCEGNLVLPPSFNNGVSSADVLIKRYVAGEDTIVPKSMECQEIRSLAVEQQEDLWNNIQSGSAEVFLEECSCLDNAKQIYDKVLELRKISLGAFSEQVVKQLADLAYIERMYGNKKERALNLLQEYCDNPEKF